MTTEIELIIIPRWIAPVVPRNTLLSDRAIAVNEGQIIAIDSPQQLRKKYTAKRTLELDDHLVFPGLINAHGHAAMSLLRGYADDLPLQTWLEDHIWPTEAKHVSYEFVRDGTELAMAEMMMAGTSCFSDMYFFPDAAAKQVIAAGMRAQICFPVMDFPTPWASNAEEYIDKGLALHQQYKAQSRITVAFGPHAPYTVSDEPFLRMAALSEELGANIQVHLHETAFEVESAVAETGKRPIERLAELGILGPRTQCVHMTQVSDSDLALLQTSASHVIHCPESNLKLASGFCPMAQLLEAGINVAIGTDGAASNNDLDMLGEARTAALLGKAIAGKADVLDAHTMLYAATMGGAKALGIDNLVGSIEIGKQADLAAIKLSDLASQPLYNPVSQLIYTNSSHKVTHLWVDGKCLLNEGQLQTLDRDKIIRNTHSWAEKIHTA